MKELIIDSDVFNSIDDQFAISYALTNPKFNILAITVCPYQVFHKRQLVFDGVVDSYFEAKRLCRLAGKPNIPVYRGATGFLDNNYTDSNDAVENIIKICKARRKTYIACLGTLTNLALAIKKCPCIARKIELIWIGTKHILEDKFVDNNYSKDKLAFEDVMKSDMKITVIPSYVGKFNATSTYEIKEHVAVNPLGKHLLNLIETGTDIIHNRGLAYIYDINVPIYLENSSLFKTKEIDRNLLLKEQEKIDKPTTLTYVFDGSADNSVYKEFIKCINLAPTDIFKSKIFFTSDTHFCQKNKIRSKEFKLKTIEQTDHEYIKKWNSTVATNDIVYHLGDFGDYNMVKQLNGKIILICGNYETKDYGQNFEKFKKRLIKLGFKDVIKHHLVLDKEVLGEPIYLTHKPKDTKLDMFNLYGHVHSLKVMMKNGLNVCTELHGFKPISETIVKDYLKFLKTKPHDNVFA